VIGAPIRMVCQLLVVLILLACRGPRQVVATDRTGGTDSVQRSRELAQCMVGNRSGDEVAKCLAVSRNWDAADALREGQRFQARVDSITVERLTELDSIEAASAKRAAPWIRCILTRRETTSGGVELYGPCRQQLPSTADYHAYVRRNQGDLAMRGQLEILEWAFGISELDRRGIRP
jgi:hypothetical protein